MEQMTLSIVPSHQVDRTKWDACIDAAPNRLIYGRSVYLDHVADNWTGIIMNDYDAVMPVPWRKKYGITYSYDVPFLQQTGVFGRCTPAATAAFLQRLQTICRAGYYHFNYCNELPGLLPRRNYVLPLTTYEHLSAGFSKDVKLNIRKAGMSGLTYATGSIDEAVALFKHLYSERLKISEDQFERFAKVCGHLHHIGQTIVRKVTDATGETIAAMLLLKDGDRMHNMMNSTTPSGRKHEANYYLFSRLFMEFQDKGLLFDFEGSDKPEIENFYRRFGAKDQPYFRYTLRWQLMFKQ